MIKGMTVWWRLRELESSDGFLRLRAARELAMLRDPRAFDPLVLALADEDHEVRAAAAEALAELGDRRAVPALVATVLRDRQPDAMHAAAEALLTLDDPRTVRALVKGLDDADVHTRQSAAWALRRIGWEDLNAAERARVAIIQSDWDEAAAYGGDSLEPLMAALRDGTSRARHEASDALARTGTPQALSSLATILKDDSVDRAVRQIVAWSLKRFNWDSLDPVTRGWVDVTLAHWDDAEALGVATVEGLSAALYEDDTDIRLQAVERLGRINQPTAWQALTKTLTDPHQFMTIRQAVIEVLQSAHYAGAQPALKECLRDRSWMLREAAVLALDATGWNPSTDAERTLLLMARHDWPAIIVMGSSALETLEAAVIASPSRIAVARHMAKLGQAGVARLMDMLKRPRLDLIAREAAVLALAERGDASILEALVATLKDPDLAIRLAAIWSLERLGWQPADDAQRALLAMAHEDWDGLLMLGPAAVEPLLKMAQQSMAADQAMTMIEQLLESIPERIVLGHLRTLCAIGERRSTADFRGKITSNGEDDTDGPDFSRVRELAKKEKLRRGLMF